MTRYELLAIIVAGLALLVAFSTFIWQVLKDRAKARASQPEINIDKLYFPAGEYDLLIWSDLSADQKELLESTQPRTRHFVHDEKDYLLANISGQGGERMSLMLSPLKVVLTCNQPIQHLAILDTYAIVQGVNICARAMDNTGNGGVSLDWALKTTANETTACLNLAYFSSTALSGLDPDKLAELKLAGRDLDFKDSNDRQVLRPALAFTETAYLFRTVRSDGSKAYHRLAIRFVEGTPTYPYRKYSTSGQARMHFEWHKQQASEQNAR